MAPNLFPGEHVLREANGYHQRYFSRYSSPFYLTNMRLIFKPLFEERSFPLTNITAVQQTSGGTYGTLRVDFDYGGQEFFKLRETAAWVEAIEKARVNAPALPQNALPAPQAQPTFPNPAMILVLFLVICVITLCVGMLFFSALLLILGIGGSSPSVGA